MPRLTLLLAVLLIALAAPSTALAQHHHPGDWYGDQDPYADDDPSAGDDNPSVLPADPAPPVATPVAPATGTTGATGATGPVDGLLPGDTDPLPDLGPPLVTTATVPGRTARMRTDGKAAIPRGAPKRIRAVIAAANLIVGKPYKWGGGHAKLIDKGYDCSGSVSFALIRAGFLTSPQVSGTLAHWATTGAGRWMTIYANKGHVYLEVAGLRLDTSAVGDPAGRDGVRWRPVIGGRPRFAKRHVLGL